jgi:hypothetical protein
MRINRSGILLPFVIGCASLFSSRAYAGEPDGVDRWVRGQGHESWVDADEIVDTDKLDTGGYFIVPEAVVPIFLTDPMGGDQIGQRTSAIAVGMQWRVGWMFRRTSIEALGGYAWGKGGSVTLPNGQPQDLNFQAGWLGGQARYTYTTDSAWHPFVGAGAAAYCWTASALIRDKTTADHVSAIWNPAAHAFIGTFVRIGKPSSLFLEFGVQTTAHFAGDVFSQTQIAVTPYLGAVAFGTSHARDPNAPAEHRSAP